MRKALLAGLLLFSMQETDVEVFEVEVSGGVTYTIYEDEDCEQQVYEEDEPVVLLSEEGKLMIPEAYAGKWLLETDTKDGYYPNDVPVEIKEDMEIVSESIHYVITLLSDGEMGECVYELVDEEGSVTELTIEESLDIGPYLSAGKTYVLRESDIPEEYALQGNVTIEVPLQKPEEELKLDLFYERRTVLLFKGEEDSGAGIMIYKDEVGEQPLREDGYYQLDEPIYLDAGTYWYRIEEIDEMYYENRTMYKLEIDPSMFQYMEETLPMERVKFVVQMEESPYIIHVYHDGEETASFAADGKEHILYGLRESTYTLRGEALHDGYDLKDMEIDTGSANDGTVIVLQPELFTVQVRMFDKYQNTYLSGTVVVKDDTGQEVTRVETDGDYAKVNGLMAGRTYWFEVLETDTVHMDERVKLTMQDSASFVVDVPVVTNVTLTLETSDKDARFNLYQDEACTMPVVDMEDIPSGSYRLLPGTYFLKQTGFGETYYRENAVMKLDVYGNVSKVIPSSEVRAVLGAKDSDTTVSEVQLELLEEGEVVERWQGEKEFVLKRGRVYALRQAAPLSGYLNGEEVKFSTMGEKPEEELSHYLALHPYTILTLHGAENAGAVLYTDETCMYPAYDVDGLVAQVHMDESGTERLRMPEGTYYMKEMGGAGFYESGEIRRVDLVSPYAEESLSPVPVSFSIRFLDEHEQPVQGAAFSLKDEAGNVLEEWISGSEDYAIQAKLLAGGAYIIHQDKAPDGYERMKTDIVYTTPLTAPETLPIVTIEAKQYAPVREKEAVQDMEDVRNEKKDNIFYGAAGVLFVLLVGIVGMNWYKKK